MDIRQLRYFHTVAEAGSITGAAQKLFLAQPSLSQQLKAMEQELGVKLFDRGSRRVSLTAAGRLLNERAETILELMSTAEMEVKELHAGTKGTLSIGSIASSGVTLLPRLIRKFHADYPNVQFQMMEGDTHRILDLLNTGLIDVGIVRSVFDMDLYHWVDFPPEPMIAATSPWSEDLPGPSLSLGDLKDMPLLLHRSNETMIVDACRRVGFEPRIFCKGDDVRSLLVWANEGMGVAIVPESALGLVPSPKLIYRQFGDVSLQIKKAVVWLRQRYLSSIAQRFISAVVENLSNPQVSSDANQRTNPTPAGP